MATLAVLIIYAINRLTLGFRTEKSLSDEVRNKQSSHLKEHVDMVLPSPKTSIM